MIFNKNVMYKFNLKRQRWVALARHHPISLKVAFTWRNMEILAQTCETAGRKNLAFSPLGTEQNKHIEREEKGYRIVYPKLDREEKVRVEMREQWKLTQMRGMLWRHYESCYSTPKKGKKNIKAFISVMIFLHILFGALKETKESSSELHGGARRGRIRT